MNCRLLQTGHQSAAFNMALDEVILKKVSSGECGPVLRFYGWTPAAVSIGYFQSLEEEVDLEQCAQRGVDVVRRQTGGGAVLHDQELTYSIHLPLSQNLVPDKILNSYEVICGAIIQGLAECGLQTEFAPINDILLKGKKISGNAQTRKEGVLLQHGTILMDVDVDFMFDLLKVPDEKLKGKLISSIKERVTALNQHLPHPPTFDQLAQHLLSGFQKQFPNLNFLPSDLTKDEKDEVNALMSSKYAKPEWNRQR